MKTNASPTDFLYNGLQHGVETELQRFNKRPNSDGQDAIVYVTALPARFYRVTGLPSTNSIGGEVKPFDISTGSGDEMRLLVLAIAKAASEGMIGIN